MVDKMSYKRILASCFLAVQILAFFSGCQKRPDKNAVVSKQNNTLFTSVPTTATEANISNETTDISFVSSFTSTDKSVNFTMDINQNIPVSNLPAVQVSPHYLTSEDAKTVALTLFPDVDFYEAESQLSENFSKSEIQEKLNRWSQYTNTDALEELYGESESIASLDIIKSYIVDYTKMYEHAPEENPHMPCAWSMRKSSEYMLLEDELPGVDLSNDSDEVCAQFTADGIPYRFSATTRNKHDFKVNIITCYIDDGLSPNNIDERIFTAKLCRKEKPTDEQIALLQEKTENFLSQFQLGQWKVDECYVETRSFGDSLEYMVHVNAVPVLNNVPVLRHPQLMSLRNENGYAPNQYLTDAQFVFSPKGDLVSFTLFTPLDIQKVENDDVNVMPINELLSLAQNHLTLTDSYHYGFGQYLFFYTEEIECNVSVSEMEYGLCRIKVPNTDDEYYYVPSVILKGSSEYIGEESGKTFYVSEEPEVLVVINAIDGTIINTTNS